MRRDIIYNKNYLKHGVCRCCKKSRNIIKGDGRCIGCIEEELFIQSTIVEGCDPYICRSKD